MELEALQAALADIQRLGASLVAISPQLEKYGRSIHRRLNLGFDVLTWVASSSSIWPRIRTSRLPQNGLFAVRKQVGRVPRRERFPLADARTLCHRLAERDS